MCVDLPQLRYVLAAAKQRSFRRAAASLNIAQPTLSKRIREIEIWLGVVLFERSTVGAQLTPLGEEFVESARRVLAELDLMESRARAGRRADTGRLEIGFYTSLSTGALRDAIFGFASRHAQVDVNITEDDRAALIPQLERGALDIIVVLGEPTCNIDYAHMSLWSERTMVALPKGHSLAGRDFIYWTDLRRECFLMSCRDPGRDIQGVLLHKLFSPGNHPTIRQFNASEDCILCAVGAKQGVGLVCESSTGNTLSDVVFREVRDGNGPTRLGFVAYWRRNSGNPILKQFLAWLQTYPAVPPARIEAVN